jgi:hypothetical protein
LRNQCRTDAIDLARNASIDQNRTSAIGTNEVSVYHPTGQNLDWYDLVGHASMLQVEISLGTKNFTQERLS